MYPPVEDETVALVDSLIEAADTLFVKKLSNNDRRWADGAEHGHQNGAYIPASVRNAGFFPELVRRAEPDRTHIHEVVFPTLWVRTGEQKNSRLVWYSNKGPEAHLTRVPRDEFTGLAPGSWLLVGRSGMPGEWQWRFLTVDSADEDARTYLEQRFGLASGFEFQLFEKAALAPLRDELDGVVDAILDALESKTLPALLRSFSFPSTEELARAARELYVSRHGLASLDPYALAAPGDALMDISRDVELELYQQHHARHYTALLVQRLANGSTVLDARTVVRQLVRGFEGIYREVMLSAVQRLKTRSGYSFEHHVEQMLRDGSVPFDKQRFVGNQRPDFILPKKRLLIDPARLADPARRTESLILSLKTVLRERWKQVVKERHNCDVYLGTVDGNVAAETVRDMASEGIYLVVPERLKADKKYAEYSGESAVLSFKEFFEDELLVKRQALWLAQGISCFGASPACPTGRPEGETA